MKARRSRRGLSSTQGRRGVAGKDGVNGRHSNTTGKRSTVVSREHSSPDGAAAYSRNSARASEYGLPTTEVEPALPRVF